jgi:hypothetical protein
VEGTRWASAIRSVANASGVDPSLVAVRDALSVASTATSSQELTALHRSRSRPQLVSSEEHQQLEAFQGGTDASNHSDDQMGTQATPNSEEWGGSAGEEYGETQEDGGGDSEPQDGPQSAGEEGDVADDNSSVASEGIAPNTGAVTFPDRVCHSIDCDFPTRVNCRSPASGTCANDWCRRPVD